MTVKLTFEFENIQQATDFLHGVSGGPSVAPPVPWIGEPFARVRCVSVASPQAGTESAAPELYGRSDVTKATEAAKAFNEIARKNLEAPKRRGRKPKVKVETAAPAEATSLPITAMADSTPVAAPFVAEADATLDDAINALRAVSEEKGMPVCFDILKRHGAVRTSDVLPRSRARFIQDCQDVIAGKDIAAAS